ncbi:MAG: C10 family peptidase, partial [Muribaculaceae bacterium]|nr:C10 family peptidase [Muribaculaceae bacterium]
PKTQREEIPYLIHTTWGQENPYNLDCPEIGNYHCVTGCVATAMAQIIKHHNYPESGNDSNAYSWNGKSLDFDFSNVVFSYDLMPEYFEGSESDEQKEAVAKLLYACGVSVNMDYNLDTKYDPYSNGSSASDNYIAYALRHYFKYDNGVKLMKRDFFSNEEWEDLIYGELENKRPVLYGGQAPAGGHQFICDGYEGDGFFHINWGWQGLGDGYFKLSSLDPSFQGVGGFEGGYDSNQTIICGIQPPVEDSSIWYPIYSTASLSVKDLINNERVMLNYNFGGIYNYSQQPVDVEILIEAISSDGKSFVSKPYPYYLAGDSEPRTTFHFNGVVGKNVAGFAPSTLYLPENLPGGDYQCYIVIRTPEGNIQKVLFPFTSISYFNLKVESDGKMTYQEGIPGAVTDIRVIDFTPELTVIQNEKAKFQITLTNFGDYEYNSVVVYKIFKDGKSVDNTAYQLPVSSILPGKSSTYKFEKAFSLAPDTYDFIFYDRFGKQISDPFQIAIGESGVESIIEKDARIDIYSINGSIVKKNASNEAISSLPKGIYIIRSGGKSFKITK